MQKIRTGLTVDLPARKTLAIHQHLESEQIAAWQRRSLWTLRSAVLFWRTGRLRGSSRWSRCRRCGVVGYQPGVSGQKQRETELNSTLMHQPV